MDFIAGVDGGGTKTKVVCASPEGKVLDTAVFGPFNMNSIGAERFSALLQELCAYLNGLGDCRALCIGSAGISNKEMTRIVETEMTRGGIENWNLVGDQVIALNGALSGEAGIALIAGTGSICYGQSTDGREARSGGWGSLMDDEGGGFALGRDALAAVVRAEDGRIAPTVLHDAVFKALQVGAVRELIGKIYAPGFGKREVAALAPLVGAAAEQGDAAALQIVEKAGRELALLVRPVAEKLGLQSARIAFAGSVLQKCAPVRSAAQTQLQTLLPQLTLAEPQGDAAAGAVLLARCKAEE